MHISSPFRSVPGVVIAASLLLGSCAQVQETFQEAGDGLVRFADGLSALAAGDSPEGTAAKPSVTASAKAPQAKASRDQSAGPMPPQDRVYQEALAARARGAEEEAFKAFRAAAEKGHAAAAYETGRAYLDGRGVKADRAKGMLQMERAVALGDARAQFFVGQAYYQGEGLKQDEAKGIALLTDAAAQGHAEAQHALGEAYSIGRGGVPKNPTWAARWYGKAAQQGLREAQYAYGLVHARGLGLPVDRTEAYRWLLVASRANHERAEVVRHALETKMAPEMIALAESWADRFEPVREQPFADAPTVMYVQQVLNTMGYDAGPVDGQPGQKTRGAVAVYRKKAGLPGDEQVSPGLVDRLLAEQAKAP